MATTAYERLKELLDGGGARYRFIDHASEGRTELVSAMRGHHPRQAAKCLVLMVKQGKKVTKFVVAVVPGDMRVDTEAVKRLMEGTYTGFASTADAERLTGCVAGTILPFAFSDEVTLLADPGIQAHEEIFFNAGRLDRSVCLRTGDYVRIANPRFERIAIAV
jgi:Ala-tRNA(Pro) deacylase